MTGIKLSSFQGDWKSHYHVIIIYFFVSKQKLILIRTWLSVCFLFFCIYFYNFFYFKSRNALKWNGASLQSITTKKKKKHIALFPIYIHAEVGKPWCQIGGPPMHLVIQPQTNWDGFVSDRSGEGECQAVHTEVSSPSLPERTSLCCLLMSPVKFTQSPNL